MKRPCRQADGLYHIKGRTYKMLIGSRQQVFHGTAFKTEGLLQKSDLIMNRWGRIVSRKKHSTAKKHNRLHEHGFFNKKGKFGFVRRTIRRKLRKTSKKTGGDDTIANDVTHNDVTSNNVTSNNADL